MAARLKWQSVLPQSTAATACLQLLNETLNYYSVVNGWLETKATWLCETGRCPPPDKNKQAYGCSCSSHETVSGSATLRMPRTQFGVGDRKKRPDQRWLQRSGPEVLPQAVVATIKPWSGFYLCCWCRSPPRQRGGWDPGRSCTESRRFWGA